MGQEKYFGGGRIVNILNATHFKWLILCYNFYFNKKNNENIYCIIAIQNQDKNEVLHFYKKIKTICSSYVKNAIELFNSDCTESENLLG